MTTGSSWFIRYVRVSPVTSSLKSTQSVLITYRSEYYIAVNHTLLVILTGRCSDGVEETTGATTKSHSAIILGAILDYC